MATRDTLRLRNVLAAAWACVMLTAPAIVRAEALDDAAVHAPPQRYMLSLPPAPVGEIAEEVLGQTLGLPVSTDDAIHAEMSFRVDGTFTPKGLAQELGYRLWNVDVALVDQGGRGLRLIPAADAPAALAGGAELVSPLMPGGFPSASRAQASAAMTSQPAPAGWADRIGIAAALLLGWVFGLTTAFTVWWRIERRRRVAPQIPSPMLLVDHTTDGDGAPIRADEQQQA